MLEWLGQTDYAIWVQQSLYGWAISLTIHAFGNAVIVGVIAIVALRAFGMFKPLPFTMFRKVLPLIWIGLVVQVLSGISLFTTKPARYFADGLFQWKLLFVLLGFLCTLYLRHMLKVEEGTWEANHKPSVWGMRVITATALAWAMVLVMGRLTAYLGQLYHA
jgi:hypothetical protein